MASIRSLIFPLTLIAALACGEALAQVTAQFTREDLAPMFARMRQAATGARSDLIR